MDFLMSCDWLTERLWPHWFSYGNIIVMIILAIVVKETGCLDGAKCEMVNTFVAVVVLLNTFFCEFRIGGHDKEFQNTIYNNQPNFNLFYKTEINLDLSASSNSVFKSYGFS